MNSHITSLYDRVRKAIPAQGIAWYELHERFTCLLDGFQQKMLFDQYVDELTVPHPVTRKLVLKVPKR